MRGLIPGAALGLAALFGLASAQGADLTGKHGTAIDFVASPKEAAAKAQKEQKLVFVLHVSGIFENPCLT